MKYSHLLPDTCTKVLLAPILSFLEKDGLGGTTSQNQLKYLFKRLRKETDQNDTLKKFFSYGDLSISENLFDDIPDREILLRGLEFLKTCQAKGEDAKRFLSILGENDIFVNTELLKVHIPDLYIIKGIGHAPEKLLKHLSNRLNWTSKSIP
jgi:hypothetical protein